MTSHLIAAYFFGMGAWKTSQLIVTLIRKLRGLLMFLTSFFDMLYMGVCTTRHWQTPGQLVQELNVCTVSYGKKFTLVLILVLNTGIKDYYNFLRKEDNVPFLIKVKFLNLPLSSGGLLNISVHDDRIKVNRRFSGKIHL